MRNAPLSFTIDDFTFGLDWVSPQHRVGLGWVTDAKNCNLTSYKALQKRRGIAKLIDTPLQSGKHVTGIFEYIAQSKSYLLVTAGSKLGYYDFDISSWKLLQDGLEDGARPSFVTHGYYCFMANGYNDNLKIFENTVNRVGIEAPSSAPTISVGLLTGLTGTYKYKYAYKRTFDNFVSNASDETDLIEVTNQSVSVEVKASNDHQVDAIVIYRTLDTADPNNTSTIFYRVTELPNEDGRFEDDINDNDLENVLSESDNTPPPKAKFIILHKDRMIYANCPDEQDGGSLFLFSKVGQPEACPSSNYQYVDRSDGNEITGLGSLPDYLVVFKRNKIAVMEGNFEEWYIISNGIGCIAPYSIINMHDKIVFLSEEGWKATDGKEVYDISKKLHPLIASKYYSYEQAREYSGVYYPLNRQMVLLMRQSEYSHIVLCGHWLASLYMDVPIEAATEEQYVGWTYHMYDHHEFKTLGTYTDSEGITRILAGNNDGIIYQLDNGYDDDGYDIEVNIETGWLPLFESSAITKTLRYITCHYTSLLPGSVKVYYDADYNRGNQYITLTRGGSAYAGQAYAGGSYAGTEGIFTELLPVEDDVTGRVFRFRIYDNSTNNFSILSIIPAFRLEGYRPD